MRQVYNEFVTVGAGHADQLRRVWLDMLADAPGMFMERLDEAMALTDEQWVARAQEFTRHDTVAFAAQAPDGRFVAFVAGYLDRDGRILTGQISHWYPGGKEQVRADVPAALMARLAEWFHERGATCMYIAVREDSEAALSALGEMGFVESGVRRPYGLDTDLDEVELVHPLWEPLCSEARYHLTAGVRRAGS